MSDRLTFASDHQAHRLTLSRLHPVNLTDFSITIPTPDVNPRISTNYYSPSLIAMMTSPKSLSCRQSRRISDECIRSSMSERRRALRQDQTMITTDVTGSGAIALRAIGPV